jgi:hypothetical protein
LAIRQSSAESIEPSDEFLFGAVRLQFHGSCGVELRVCRGSFASLPFKIAFDLSRAAYLGDAKSTRDCLSQDIFRQVSPVAKFSYRPLSRGH